MTIRLKPLFEGEANHQHLATVFQNLCDASGRLYGNKEQHLTDKLELMTHAVSIQDEDARKAFVSLITKWSYSVGVQIEAYEAIQKVKLQLDTVIKSQ